MRRSLLRACAALGGLLLAVVGAEAACRLLGIDWEFKARAHLRQPPYYRQPTRRDGPFFRRPGPLEWRGRPQTEALRCLGFADADLGDPEVVVRYDAEGFRNAPGLDDWEVVVAGDSFVEAGYLPQDELLTSVLARRLGRPVKNLGLSCTGTVAQTHFLRRHGRGRSTRDAVVAFFDGNDVADVARETSMAAAPLDPDGPADLLDGLRPQSSPSLALLRWAMRRSPPTPRVELWHNATLVATRAPLTVEPAPPAPDAAALAKVDAAIGGWAAACRELGLTPWLLLLPCKRRALDGHVELRDEANAAWRPDGLPTWIEARCRAHGVRFVDATPALVAEVARGALPYNAVWDTHLNASGHRIVGELLATALAGPR